MAVDYIISCRRSLPNLSILRFTHHLPRTLFRGRMIITIPWFGKEGKPQQASVCPCAWPEGSDGLRTTPSLVINHSLNLCCVLLCHSSTPLWHMMIFISVSMYSTSYMARDCESANLSADDACCSVPIVFSQFAYELMFRRQAHSSWTCHSEGSFARESKSNLDCLLGAVAFLTNTEWGRYTDATSVGRLIPWTLLTLVIPGGAGSLCVVSTQGSVS